MRAARACSGSFKRSSTAVLCTARPPVVPRITARRVSVSKKQEKVQSRCRQRQRVAAFPGLTQLFGAGGRNRDRQKRAKYTIAATELLQLLTMQQEPQHGAAARIAELVEVLLSCQDIAFQEQLLGPGPWLVLYTQGGPQLWKATYTAGKLVNPNNAASQDLDPTDRTVVNRAEYFGNKLYVTASGTYEPVVFMPWPCVLSLQDPRTTLPKSIQANITSGLIHVLGFDVPLPIRGTGRFEVVWLDQNLRVFRSGNAISVQVRQGYLEAPFS